MWLLRLNHWMDKAEYKNNVAIADTKEELEAFVEKHKVEPYTDEKDLNWYGQPHRVHFEGELRNFNLPDWDSYTEIPSLEEHLTQCEENYLQFLNSLRKV